MDDCIQKYEQLLKVHPDWPLKSRNWKEGDVHNVYAYSFITDAGIYIDVLRRRDGKEGYVLHKLRPYKGEGKGLVLTSASIYCHRDAKYWGQHIMVEEVIGILSEIMGNPEKLEP
jgi:hypothetical protein